MKHMNRLHGLASTRTSHAEADYYSYINPSDRAFDGKLKSYGLEVKDEHELDLQSLFASHHMVLDGQLIQFGTLRYVWPKQNR